MNRLLVTGGAGFIGANFVQYWADHYPDDHIVVLDALTYAGNRANLADLERQDLCRFVHGDILDTTLVESLLREEKLNVLVHFAAESHVDRSISGPDAFIETNIVGTHSLLKAARQVWMTEKRCLRDHRFHHVSTDEVFGSLTPEDPAFNEQTAYAPNSPYSASKAASDFFVRAYHHTYGMNVTTSNCSNNYGPLHFPEKLIPLVILNILHGKPLPIYGDGLNIRDWLYVTDHAYGIDLVIKRGEVGETYNIGGCNEWTNIDIVRLICSLVDQKFASDEILRRRFPDSPAAKNSSSDSLITYVQDRAGHDFRYAIDTDYISNTLGYQPKVTFEQGIAMTLDWYLSNEKWWQAVMDGSYQEWIESNYKAA
ncbi:MAG: dTDP-glucose 4,6-dehydratase [Gammaproteobacteria bacterium]|nr:dTDP-glucose 4,6-dehydratase [Gammaproteobacteria bacterium]